MTQYKRSTFGFVPKRPVKSVEQRVESTVKTGELTESINLAVAELDFAVDHSTRGHRVQLGAEPTLKEFWSFIWALLSRRGEHDHFAEIQPNQRISMSDFRISQLSPLPPPDHDIDNDTSLSFYIDGEAYTPDTLVGKLLPAHVDIIC